MMSRFYIGVVAGIVALAAGGAAQTVTERMGVWVPLYVLPRGAGEVGDEYNKLIASVEQDACLTDSFHGTVLTGPASGPPSVTDKAERELYRERFTVVSKTSQWTAFGYVTTRYGKRPLKEVLSDIATWLEEGEEIGFGDQVQGIWVDNVRSTFDVKDGVDYADYYKQVAQKIRSMGKIVAFNPGTQIDDCKFLEDNEVSFVNNLEDYYEKWAPAAEDKCKLACVCAKSNITRCIASIHQYPAGADVADLAKTMSAMATRGYKAVFLTDRKMPDHYLQLPTFWPSVVDAACKTVIDTAAVTKAADECAPYKPFCPDFKAPNDAQCYAVVRPKVYAPETYKSPTTAAVLHLAELQLFVGGKQLPTTALTMAQSTVLRWNSTQLPSPGFVPLVPEFCNDGNTTSLMTWNTVVFNATLNKNVTVVNVNTGPGQLCHTGTFPYNNAWDPCPWVAAAYDCALGPLSALRVWNRNDSCSIDCRARIDRFAVDVVYKGRLAGQYAFSGGSTTPIFNIPL